MAGLVDGRIAVVTGAARGLGRSIAAALSASGATGLVLDLAGALDAMEPVPGFAARACDVTDETALAECVRTAVGLFGTLDIVIANAGIVPPWRETAALDFAEWDEVMAVNARGVAATLKHAAPAMMARGGAIVAMASINAFTAHPRQMAYTASKHAVLGIVRAAARDLGRFGIRVNGVAPGPILTRALRDRIRARALTGPSEADALTALAAETALGRLATEAEVANAALFLASDLSSGVTGQLLPVDAGLR